MSVEVQQWWQEVVQALDVVQLQVQGLFVSQLDLLRVDVVAQ